MAKTKHNKKRNTAVLYELLATELTKNIVANDKAAKDRTISVIKEFFQKGTVLAQELELYSTLRESEGMDDDTARRLLDKVIDGYNGMDLDVIFAEQTKLLKRMNDNMPKSVFSNFIPDYKSLASISQIFSKSTPIKEKVLLEQQIVEKMTHHLEEKNDDKMEVIDNLTYKTFVNSFNNAYGESLLPEQKELMTRFVMSFSDNGVELKSFLNEELGRLKKEVEGSLQLDEVVSDPGMKEKTELVLEKMSNYHKMPINEGMIEEVLKIQGLVGEIKD